MYGSSLYALIFSGCRFRYRLFAASFPAYRLALIPCTHSTFRFSSIFQIISIDLLHPRDSLGRRRCRGLFSLHHSQLFKNIKYGYLEPFGSIEATPVGGVIFLPNAIFFQNRSEDLRWWRTPLGEAQKGALPHPMFWFFKAWRATLWRVALCRSVRLWEGRAVRFALWRPTVELHSH
jgi:hypothetical protein